MRLSVEINERICPVCLSWVRAGRTVWNHLDTVGNLCVMSGQAPVEGVVGS